MTSMSADAKPVSPNDDFWVPDGFLIAEIVNFFGRVLSVCNDAFEPVDGQWREESHETRYGTFKFKRVIKNGKPFDTLSFDPKSRLCMYEDAMGELADQAQAQRMGY